MCVVVGKFVLFAGGRCPVVCVCVCGCPEFVLAIACRGCVACASAHLPVLGALVATKPHKNRVLGCRGGAFKSYCLGAGQGPNTTLTNLV